MSDSNRSMFIGNDRKITCPHCAKQYYPSSEFHNCHGSIQSDRNWNEDQFLENGNYDNRCNNCGQVFVGLRGRGICRVCAARNPINKPSKVEVIATVGIDQIMSAMEAWLDKCCDGECAMHYTDKLRRFSERM